MSKLPVISGKRLVKVLKKNGFKVLRQKGSHIFIENKSAELSTVIPVHANEDLGKGLLKAILMDLEMTVEDLIKML